MYKQIIRNVDKKLKILVTGANGYIGTGLVEKLLNDGNEVIATDIKLDKVDNRAKKMEANIFEIDNPYIYFGKPDVVIHLAWRDGFKHASMNHLLDLPKHYEFLSKLIDNGLHQLCVMGTMHEIGFYEGCIDENTGTNPQNLYGISKNALRQAIQLKVEENEKSILQWIRGYYIVGNTQQGCSIFSKIVQAESSGENEFPFTMGNNQYDFIDYDDFCMQVAKTVEQTEITGIINCCSGYPLKLGDRVEQFIKENNLKINLKYGAFPDRPYDSKAVWGNDRKINEIMEGVRA